MGALTDGTQAKELAWLLEYLQETLESFKEGLEECRKLLAPTEPGSTLAMSSVRSEQVKGYVNRVGTEVAKGVRLSSLPSKLHKKNSHYMNMKLTTLPYSP